MVKQQLDSQNSMPDYYMSIEFTEYVCTTAKKFW